MHAVVIKVSVQDEEPSLKFLRENIVPGVSQAPGFVAGYWVRLEGGDEGNSGRRLRVRGRRPCGGRTGPRERRCEPRRDAQGCHGW